MKTLKYIFAIALGLSATVSCYELDLLPKDAVDDATMFNSDYGITKYLAISYHDLPIEDFSYYVNKGDEEKAGYMVTGKANQWMGVKNSPSCVSGEAIGFLKGQYNDYEYWTWHGEHNVWNRIRELNYFIGTLPAYAELYPEAQYNAYLGEARFLRAFYYFALARRYGGVPLVTEAQSPAADPADLQMARSTEYDTWKFIHDELQFAMENATESIETTGRANRYVAAALMSRAMLYAGSIAKYGSYRLTGLSGVTESIDLGYMGIPSDRAQEFFQASYDAAKFIADSGKYSLHGLGAADDNAREKAFVEVFTTQTSEDIFIKQYGLSTDGVPFSAALCHSWDGTILSSPSMTPAPGASMSPAWDLLRLYEMPAISTDPDWTVGTPVRFASRNDFWDTDAMEPRARATFYFSGMTETGTNIVFDIQKGVYTDYPGTVADGTPLEGKNEFTGDMSAANAGRRKTAGNANAETFMDIFGQNVRVMGPHGSSGKDETITKSGVYVRKYVSNNGTLRALNQSTQPWKAFRYGEILLNRAEAAYELGLKEEAFACIADIRTRAGASPRPYNPGAKDVGVELGYGFEVDENLQFIREERARELAFENHAIYDQIRWRTADVKFKEFVQRTLQPYFVMGENKWIFLPEVDPSNHRLTFEARRYYNSIPGEVRQKNPKIIDNAGY